MKALTVVCNMIDPDLDSELSLANEFVLEALKAESVDHQRDLSSISKDTKYNCSAGFDSYYGRCSANDLGCFFNTNNEDQSLNMLDSLPEQLDEKALFSVKDQENVRLVPDIAVNQTTAIRYESNPSDPCSIWSINNSSFPKQTVSCLIKSETSTTSCYFSLPNIIDRMDLLDLDSFYASPNNFPLNIKEEPIDLQEDIRVDFLNIKDVYYKQAEGIEDSFLCVYVQTDSKLKGVKLFINHFQYGMSGHFSQGPICLPSEYNRRSGMLSVNLNCLPLYLPPLSDTTDTQEGASSLWQFIVKIHFEDGRSVSHFSKTFQIRRKRTEEYEDEKDFKRKLKQIPLTPINGSSVGLSSSLYPSNTERYSESFPKNCTLESIRSSKLAFECQNSVFSDDTTSVDVLGYGTKNIMLAPGTTLDKSAISKKIRNEKDIVSIQEQANFTGLLKVMKTNNLQDTSRRKANGYRSAEEAFVWACGHCFFSRGKKSTVKSHVSRQVCQKRRRMLSECSTSQAKNAKPKFRRCHTFSGIQSKSMRNYCLKRCKTP